jgi:hypothetical protein
MSEGGVGPVRTLLARMCHACPICKFGRERPESVLGRILSHPLHANHCPMWKAEKEMYGSARQEPTAT